MVDNPHDLSVPEYNERQYLQSLTQIHDQGEMSDNRTGINTISLFGAINNTYKLSNGGAPTVPMLSTKYVNFESIIHELIWMLSGSSRLKYLLDNKVNIWNEWVLPGTEVKEAISHGERLGLFLKKSRTDYNDTLDIRDRMREDGRSEEFIVGTEKAIMDTAGVPAERLVDGDLGPVYGAQWRRTEDLRMAVTPEQADALHSRGFQPLIDTGTAQVCGRILDQIEQLEKDIVSNPNSRRLIVSAWNVARIDEMALPPCHTLAQWRITNDKQLHCKLYQRSADWMIGVPYNIVFYSALTHMLCHAHGLRPGNLYHAVGDAHIYENHLDGYREQQSRIIKSDNQPRIRFSREFDSILDIRAEHIQLEGYTHHPYIPLAVAV